MTLAPQGLSGSWPPEPNARAGDPAGRPGHRDDPRRSHGTDARSGASRHRSLDSSTRWSIAPAVAFRRSHACLRSRSDRRYRSPLVPLLISAGHDVIGLARSQRAGVALEALGADVVHADALDHAAMRRAVRVAAPDSVVHLVTATPLRIDPKRMAREFAQTNRLRTEGTLNLVDAAADAGAKRVLTQGLAYVYDANGPAPATELRSGAVDNCGCSGGVPVLCPQAARVLCRIVVRLAGVERGAEAASGIEERAS